MKGGVSPEPEATPALTREQAAACLGVVPEFFENHVLPTLFTVEVSGHQCIPPSELQRWLHAPVDDRMMTLREVAAEVKASQRTVLRAIRAGELKASQLNEARGGWRIHASAVEDWLKLRAKRRPRSTAPRVKRVEPMPRARSVRHEAHHEDEGRLEP